MGLCGNHAYSILDVREVKHAQLPHGRVQLVRIRNPHGVGEWNGEWSDKSAEWSRLVGGGGGKSRALPLTPRGRRSRPAAGARARRPAAHTVRHVALRRLSRPSPRAQRRERWDLLDGAASCHPGVALKPRRPTRFGPAFRTLSHGCQCSENASAPSVVLIELHAV